MNMDIMRTKYDLGIINITKNEDSTDGNVYNVITNNSKYIIKVYDDINKANNMVSIHNYLSDLYIPRIIKNNEGEYITKCNDKYIILYSFLDGNSIDIFNGVFSLDLIKSIAKEVRRLHDMTLNKDFNLERLDFCNKLERKSLLHFDLTKGNIFNNDSQIGFIDFDDSKYGDSVCDVAILISFLFVSKKRGINNDGINIFIDSYYGEDNELRNKEIPYIRLYIKDWINYLLDGHKFDTSLQASFEFKKESADEIKID